MKLEEQMKLWMEGQSMHLGERPGGLCCPDFSCCKPDLQWPAEKRREFAEADDDKRYDMLLGALGALLDYEEIRKVHIIGREE